MFLKHFITRIRSRVEPSNLTPMKTLKTLVLLVAVLFWTNICCYAQHSINSSFSFDNYRFDPIPQKSLYIESTFEFNPFQIFNQKNFFDDYQISFFDDSYKEIEIGASKFKAGWDLNNYTHLNYKRLQIKKIFGKKKLHSISFTIKNDAEFILAVRLRF